MEVGPKRVYVRTSNFYKRNPQWDKNLIESAWIGDLVSMAATVWFIHTGLLFFVYLLIIMTIISTHEISRINNEWSFDDAIAYNVTNCEVYSFDPTMDDWKNGDKRGERITFYQMALASKNGDQMSLITDVFSRGRSYRRGSPTWDWRTLRGSMEMLGHQVFLCFSFTPKHAKEYSSSGLGERPMIVNPKNIF